MDLASYRFLHFFIVLGIICASLYAFKISTPLLLSCTPTVSDLIRARFLDLLVIEGIAKRLLEPRKRCLRAAIVET